MTVDDVLKEMSTTKVLVQDWRLTAATFRRLSMWKVIDRYGQTFNLDKWFKLIYQHPVFKQLSQRRDFTIVGDYLRKKVDNRHLHKRAHDSFKNVRETIRARGFEHWREVLTKEPAFAGLPVEALQAMHKREIEKSNVGTKYPWTKGNDTVMLGSQDWKTAWVTAERKRIKKEECPKVWRLDGEVQITVNGSVTVSGSWETTEYRTEHVSIEWALMMDDVFFLAVAGYIEDKTLRAGHRPYSPVRGRWFKWEPHNSVEVDEWRPPGDKLGYGAPTKHDEGTSLTFGYLWAKAKQDAKPKDNKQKRRKKQKKGRRNVGPKRGKQRSRRQPNDEDTEDDGGSTPLIPKP
jgi:hypothetical protein